MNAPPAPNDESAILPCRLSYFQRRSSVDARFLTVFLYLRLIHAHRHAQLETFLHMRLRLHVLRQVTFCLFVLFFVLFFFKEKEREKGIALNLGPCEQTSTRQKEKLHD